MTRFEDLEETHAEVKLKQTLWLTQKEWESDHEGWMQVIMNYSNWCIIPLLLSYIGPLLYKDLCSQV